MSFKNTCPEVRRIVNDKEELVNLLNLALNDRAFFVNDLRIIFNNALKSEYVILSHLTAGGHKFLIKLKGAEKKALHPLERKDARKWTTGADRAKSLKRIIKRVKRCSKKVLFD